MLLIATLLTLALIGLLPCAMTVLQALGSGNPLEAIEAVHSAKLLLAVALFYLAEALYGLYCLARGVRPSSQHRRTSAVLHGVVAAMSILCLLLALYEAPVGTLRTELENARYATAIAVASLLHATEHFRSLRPAPAEQGVRLSPMRRQSSPWRRFLRWIKRKGRAMHKSSAKDK